MPLISTGARRGPRVPVADDASRKAPAKSLSCRRCRMPCGRSRVSATIVPSAAEAERAAIAGAPIEARSSAVAPAAITRRAGSSRSSASDSAPGAGREAQAQPALAFRPEGDARRQPDAGLRPRVAWRRRAVADRRRPGRTRRTPPRGAACARARIPPRRWITTSRDWRYCATMLGDEALALLRARRCRHIARRSPHADMLNS